MGKAMNIDHAQELIQAIADHQDQFNMSSYIYFGKPSCIVGFAAWLALGKPEKIEHYYNFRQCAGEFLELDYETTRKLAGLGLDSAALYRITAGQAITVIERLAETGKVDWSIFLPREEHDLDALRDSVSPELLREYLAGEAENFELIRAFTWHLTPQGHDYWYDIYTGRKELSADDRAFLESLLA